MKFSVLINNYNYARFLKETIDSVCAQSYPAYEIIVVDDGSTDESLTLLSGLEQSVPNLRVVAKSNGGQLSAFRAGVNLATGDYCCFLDADDKWAPDHLCEAHNALKDRARVGLYFSNLTIFSDSAPNRTDPIWPCGEFGPVAGLVAASGFRFGGATSTMILKRNIARSVVDIGLDFDESWRVRADDCLALGASLTGTLLYFNEAATVLYRIHGSNCYARKKYDEYEIYSYGRAKDHIFSCYESKFGIDRDRLSRLLWIEYANFPSNRKDKRCRELFYKALRKVPCNLRLRFRFWVRLRLPIG